MKKIYTRPNGDSTRSCACCQKNCDFVTMGVNNQSILQRWLDGDRSNGITTKSTSSSTISTPVTTRGSGFSLPNTLDSSATSSTRSAPSRDGTPTVSDAIDPNRSSPHPTIISTRALSPMKALRNPILQFPIPTPARPITAIRSDPVTKRNQRRLHQRNLPSLLESIQPHLSQISPV